MELINNGISSKTLYLAKNQRSINSMIGNRRPTRTISEKTISSSIKIDYNSIEQMTLKEKAKNFLECYDDLVMMITQKT